MLRSGGVITPVAPCCRRPCVFIGFYFILMKFMSSVFFGFVVLLNSSIMQNALIGLLLFNALVLRSFFI